jgi:CHAT domain-containing protein/Flp pilus assembly protein TadD
MNSRRVRVGVFLLISLVVPCVVTAAEDPLAGVGQLLFAGKIAEARVQIEKARQTYVTQGNASGEAVSYLFLGLTDVALDKASDARADLAESSGKFTALGDHFGAWMSLWVLADLERREGSDDAALAASERSIALLSDAKVSNTPFSIESMKAVGAIFGAPLEGLGPVMQNPEIVKPLLLRFAEVISRDSYGAALMESGALEKADEQLGKADELAALFGGFFDSSIAMHIGDLRRRQWRFDEAAKSYSKALDGAKFVSDVLPVHNPWIEVEIVGKLADMAILSGRVDEALALNDRALKIVRASTDPKREASILEDRGELLWRAGRFSAAEAAVTDALKVATENRDDYRSASILTRLGMMNMFRGAYGTAASQLQKSVEIYRKLNQPYVEAPTWILLAEVYLLLEDRDSAGVALEKARELAKKSNFKIAAAMVDVVAELKKFGPGQEAPASLGEAFATLSAMPEMRSLATDGDSPLVLGGIFASPATDPGPIPATTSPMVRGMALMLNGRLLLMHGDFAGARAALTEALKTNPSREHRAGMLALIGASYWKEGNAHEAIDYFEQSAKALDSVVSDVKVEEMLAAYLGSNRRWYYEVLIEMLVQQGRVVEAFEYAERARARAFLQTIGNHRLNAELGGDASLVREAEILRAQIANWEQEANQAQPPESIRIRSDLEFARQRYKSLVNRIKISNPEYSALAAVAPLKLDEVRNELPADTALISYFVLPHGVHAWVVDRTDLHHVVLPIDAAGLQRIVCWAAHFAPARDLRGAERTADKCTGAATADEAYAKLIAPLREHIHNNRLILVPHNVLHYVPFAALHDAGSNRYLIEDYTLSYIPSASALRFLRSKETPIKGAALILGNPSSDLPAARQIRGAEEEALAVAGHLGSKAVLGPQARESLLYGLGGNIDLVHIASHAIYDSVNPLFSRIALAPGDGYDGNVEVHEILSSLDLTGVNLVVLSACETAVGERSGGDEIVGLTRALLYAGTPGVISTLWRIDDTSSARLMDEFYRRLAAGALAADALRDAQIAVLRSDHYADPKYWAAFTLSGNPRGRWTANPAP